MGSGNQGGASLCNQAAGRRVERYSIALLEEGRRQEAHLRYQVWVETQSVTELLDGVANGTLDAVVAAVTVTARACTQCRLYPALLQYRSRNRRPDQ